MIYSDPLIRALEGTLEEIGSIPNVAQRDGMMC